MGYESRCIIVDKYHHSDGTTYNSVLAVFDLCVMDNGFNDIFTDKPSGWLYAINEEIDKDKYGDICTCTPIETLIEYFRENPTIIEDYDRANIFYNCLLSFRDLCRYGRNLYVYHYGY